jgi:hypothetical protein
MVYVRGVGILMVKMRGRHEYIRSRHTHKTEESRVPTHGRKDYLVMPRHPVHKIVYRNQMTGVYVKTNMELRLIVQDLMTR